VRAGTTQNGKGSKVCHTKLGYYIENGAKEKDGVSVFSDYDSPGQDRILFQKTFLLKIFIGYLG
jgi:hypothetical protein